MQPNIKGGLNNCLFICFFTNHFFIHIFIFFLLQSIETLCIMHHINFDYSSKSRYGSLRNEKQITGAENGKTH